LANFKKVVFGIFIYKFQLQKGGFCAYGYFFTHLPIFTNFKKVVFRLQKGGFKLQKGGF